MDNAIFLSAGIPDPKRGPEYAKTADTVAIAAAVAALVHVTLGRRPIVWGGHPAITPMIWELAASIKVDYGSWVALYQSKHFEEDFPEENLRFGNVTFTKDVEGDREKSLLAMRTQMFEEHSFAAAVFIGGMQGVIAEFELLRRIQPTAIALPVISTGGAAAMLQNQMPSLPPDLADDLDYVSLFHRHLGIAVKEERFERPEVQSLSSREVLEVAARLNA